MKFFRLMLFFSLLCLVFPLMSYADQLEDANAAIENEDFKKAYKLLLPLAEENNAEAQNLMGTLCAHGQGVEKDLTKSMSWIMKAARQGYEPAKMNAFKLCLHLGDLGDTAAMYNVGYMCLNGWGGEQDNDGCLGWLETAGKNGHAKSAKYLASIYTKGSYGITPDEEKASDWSNMVKSFAAGIDGKWAGSVPTGPDDAPPMVLSYDFKANGDKLTGTTIGFGGKAIKIKDGKIDKINNLSFKVVSRAMGMKSTIEYTGVFLGETLHLTYTMAGGPDSQPITFIASRTE